MAQDLASSAYFEDCQFKIRGVGEIAKSIKRIDLRLDSATDASDDQPAVMKAALHKHCPVNVFTTQAGIEINEHWTVRPLDK